MQWLRVYARTDAQLANLADAVAKIEMVVRDFCGAECGRFLGLGAEGGDSCPFRSGGSLTRGYFVFSEKFCSFSPGFTS